MTDPATMTSVVIRLVADAKPCLVILLADDGSINRLGTGRRDNDELDLYVGFTDLPLFQSLIAEFPDGLMDQAGVYDLPDQRGVPMTLSVLWTVDGKESGIEFHYGSASVGPPEEIVAFVRRALELTDDWYRAQKQAATDQDGTPGRRQA